MIRHQLPYDLSIRIAAAFGEVSYSRMNRPWRSRSNSTHCNWVALTRHAVGELPLPELWDIASCLYAACAARVIGGTEYCGRAVTSDGWKSIAALLRDFRRSKPEYALTRDEWCNLYPNPKLRK
jgi:hypothetical protein